MIAIESSRVAWLLFINQYVKHDLAGRLSAFLLNAYQDIDDSRQRHQLSASLGQFRFGLAKLTLNFLWRFLAHSFQLSANDFNIAQLGLGYVFCRRRFD